MEKPKRPYSLFKRPTVKSNTFIHYCRFRDGNGDYMSPISSLQFSKAAARNWADERLRRPCGRSLMFGTRERYPERLSLPLDAPGTPSGHQGFHFRTLQERCISDY